MGLRKGCVFSSSLFNVYIDATMWKVTERVTDLDFVDDVILLAD